MRALYALIGIIVGLVIGISIRPPLVQAPVRCEQNTAIIGQ